MGEIMKKSYMSLVVACTLFLVACGTKSPEQQAQIINQAVMQILDNKGNAKVQQKAFDELMELAQKGNPDAMYQVGQLYIEPSAMQGVIQTSPQEAEKWLLKSAELDHRPAQIALGNAYKLGAYRFEKSHEKSCHWLKKAFHGDDSIIAKVNLEPCNK